MSEWPPAERCAGAGSAAGQYSARTVRVGFEDAESFDQRVEFRCVVADDAGVAHGVVVRLQDGELVVVGNETQPAVEALIVVGVADVEEHLLVLDYILEEITVGERSLADSVVGEALEVEPVAGESVGAVRQPAAVACDMDERRLLPKGTGR